MVFFICVENEMWNLWISDIQSKDTVLATKSLKTDEGETIDYGIL